MIEWVWVRAVVVGTPHSTWRKGSGIHKLQAGGNSPCEKNGGWCWWMGRRKRSGRAWGGGGGFNRALFHSKSPWLWNVDMDAVISVNLQEALQPLGFC